MVWVLILEPCQSQTKDLELIQTGYKNEEAQKLQGIPEFIELLVLQFTKQLLLLMSRIMQRTPKIAFSHREEQMILHVLS